MKSLLKQLHHRTTVVFLDLEGTQFSHEMIAIGAIKVDLKTDGSIKKQYKGFKLFVKPKAAIGNFVTKLTGITKEMLEKDGLSYKETLEKLQKYCGHTFLKSAFITFGSHDLRIFMQSLLYSPDASEEIAKQIARNTIDLSLTISQFIKDDKNNPLSLSNYLKVFNHVFEGTPHDPLADAKNLIKVYSSCLSEKNIIFDEYLKVLKNMNSLPLPVLKAIQKLILGETVVPEDFQKEVREFIG
jgi:DNA polymerase III alpha subunit (gram-positive type)